MRSIQKQCSEQQRLKQNVCQAYYCDYYVTFSPPLQIGTKMRLNAYSLNQGQVGKQIRGLDHKRSMVEQQHESQQGTLINCYKLRDELGHGTFGKVFLVNTVKDEEYAMKVSKGNMMKYLRVEENFLKKIEQYNIAPLIIDSFEYTDKYCIVMTHCQQKLSEMIQGKLSLDEMKVLMRTAAQHVQILHNLQIIHADIKTDNFLILQKGNPASLKIIDFSSSLQLPRDIWPTKLMSRYFKAPEVLHHQRYGYKIDMWSLGCLFYEIVFKRPMFPSKTDEMLALQHMAVLGIPSYGAYDFFMDYDTQFYLQNKAMLDRYGIQNTSPKLPVQNVLWSTGRPECEPRNIRQKINKETKWAQVEKDNFADLLEGLIKYNPDERWDCQDILDCEFLN